MVRLERRLRDSLAEGRRLRDAQGEPLHALSLEELACFAEHLLETEGPGSKIEALINARPDITGPASAPSAPPPEAPAHESAQTNPADPADLIAQTRAALIREKAERTVTHA